MSDEPATNYHLQLYPSDDFFGKTKKPRLWIRANAISTDTQPPPPLLQRPAVLATDITPTDLDSILNTIHCDRSSFLLSNGSYDYKRMRCFALKTIISQYISERGRSSDHLVTDFSYACRELCSNTTALEHRLYDITWPKIVQLAPEVSFRSPFLNLLNISCTLENSGSTKVRDRLIAVANFYNKIEQLYELLSPIHLAPVEEICSIFYKKCLIPFILELQDRRVQELFISRYEQAAKTYDNNRLAKKIADEKYLSELRQRNYVRRSPASTPRLQSRVKFGDSNKQQPKSSDSDPAYYSDNSKLESPIEALFYPALCTVANEHTCRPKIIPNLPVEANGHNYRIDFVIEHIHDNILLGVEVDGREHHTSEEDVARDKKRDRNLVKAGWTVIRFTGSEVFKDASGCAREAISCFSSLIDRCYQCRQTKQA